MLSPPSVLYGACQITFPFLSNSTSEETARFSVAPVRRRKWGEGSRIVHHWFAAHPGAALTIREIADRTGLAYTSVQGLLKKERGWKKDKENRWSLAQ